MYRLSQVIFLCISLHAGAQVRIDATVGRRFDSAFSKTVVDAKQKNNTSKIYAKAPTATAIIRVLAEDTLNKADIILPGADIQISDPDGSVTVNNEKSDYSRFPIPLHVSLNRDTLSIVLVPMFLRIKLTGKTATSYFAEYQKGDPVFRLHASDAWSEMVEVPFKKGLYTISSGTFKKGDDLYGEVVLKSSPYFIKNSDSKAGYLKKQVRCGFLFHIKIQGKEM
jgi:hypothetical protein